eukprot:5262483-Pyramimonas_sp.AAC.1
MPSSSTGVPNHLLRIRGPLVEHPPVASPAARLRESALFCALGRTVRAPPCHSEAPQGDVAGDPRCVCLPRR